MYCLVSSLSCRRSGPGGLDDGTPCGRAGVICSSMLLGDKPFLNRKIFECVASETGADVPLILFKYFVAATYFSGCTIFFAKKIPAHIAGS